MMRARSSPLWVAALVTVLSITAGSQAPTVPFLGATESHAAPALETLPVSFVPNRGLVGSSVRFFARGAGYSFAFERDRVRLTLERGGEPTRLTLRFLGARSEATLLGVDRQSGTVGYFLGKDASRWHPGLPTYATLVYRGVWPGIDLAFSDRAGRLEYEFRLRPGAHPDAIKLAYAGASGLSVGRNGHLLIDTPNGVLTDRRPRSFQRVGGRQVAVESHFVVRGRTVGIATGDYDSRRQLVIDPGVVYSTYLGGSAFEGGFGVAVDQSGAVYATGRTSSLDFPAPAGSFDGSYNGSDDVFVAKLAADGTSLVYAAYLGGSSLDEGRGVGVDSGGNLYVTGYTTSADFPTASAADSSYNGGRDGFVAKLDPTGSNLLFSTYLGAAGDDNALALSLVPGGGAYVTGETSSSGFPTTPGAFDRTANGDFDTFLTKVGSAGSIAWSTYLGGPGFDDGLAIAVGPNGNPYVTGKASAGHPTTPGAFDTSQNGGFDAFVAQFSADGAQLVYCTYLGGDSWDEGLGLAVDSGGSAYLTGNVQSADFPTTSGVWDRTLSGPVDLFVTRLNAAGSALVYSTLLGGTSWDEGDGLGIDGSGRAYVSGHAESSDYPTTEGAFDATYNGSVEAFLSVVAPTGASLDYSTYLGASGWDGSFAMAVDGGGAAYVVGMTDSAAFPTTPASLDPTPNGDMDAFVTKIDPTGASPPPPPPPTIDFSLSATPASQTVGRGSSTTYTIEVQPSSGFTGAVALSVSGLPKDTVGAFNPNPTATTSTLTVTTSRWTKPPGTYTLTIQGTSGGLTRTTTVTLIVKKGA